ncbi:MAG: rhodanese-like domain-containing protein [Deltaproteobacteria bacterium]|nr:rhodanese-like domain-containing protein [Deltaproteobacteria bacterium]
MKTKLSFLLGISVLGLGAQAIAAPPAPRAIEPKEVLGLLVNDFAVVVDVREAEERTETIDKARWMPNSKIEDGNAEWKTFLSKLPKDKTIVFHCVAGARAEHAASMAAAQGFKTAYFEAVFPADPPAADSASRGRFLLRSAK